MFLKRKTPAVTKEQKIFYKENGYIIIRNNIPHNLIDELIQRFVDICNERTDSDVAIVMKDISLSKKGAKGEYLINKVHDFPYDEILSKYITCNEILDIIEDLIGPNISAVNSMLINKPPNAEEDCSIHPLHQDLNYFPFRPADKIIGTWTAMEHVDQNNGCLYVVPGSHKGPLYKHMYPDGTKKKLYHGIQDKDNLPKTFAIMEKGDTIFFHPLMLHGSGPNRTQGFRKAISAHYASNDCHFIDVKGTLQEDIGKELEDLIKRKRNWHLSYAEIWSLKSRLVRGNPGTLQSLQCQL